MSWKYFFKAKVVTYGSQLTQLHPLKDAVPGPGFQREHR